LSYLLFLNFNYFFHLAKSQKEEEELLQKHHASQKEQLRQEISQEQERLIKEQEEIYKKMLESHREKLVALAREQFTERYNLLVEQHVCSAIIDHSFFRL
jgi:ATP-dependent Zn protease